MRMFLFLFRSEKTYVHGVCGEDEGETKGRDEAMASNFFDPPHLCAPILNFG